MTNWPTKRRQQRCGVLSLPMSQQVWTLTTQRGRRATRSPCRRAWICMLSVRSWCAQATSQRPRQCQAAVVSSSLDTTQDLWPVHGRWTLIQSITIFAAWLICSVSNPNSKACWQITLWTSRLRSKLIQIMTSSPWLTAYWICVRMILRRIHGITAKRTRTM